MSAAGTALDNLRAARGPHDPEERAELREEVQITALLLIAHELETIANGVTQALLGIDTAIRSITNTDELEEEAP